MMKLAIAFAVVFGAVPGQDKGPPGELTARLEAKLGPGEKPFTLLVTVKIKAGQGEKFEAAAAKAAAATRKESGNVAYDFHRDLDTPDRYLLFERWKSVAALKEHLAAAHTQEFLRLVGELGDGPPQIQLFTPLAGP
jgi:quinol monooxygenase YgiN